MSAAIYGISARYTTGFFVSQRTLRKSFAVGYYSWLPIFHPWLSHSFHKRFIRTNFTWPLLYIFSWTCGQVALLCKCQTQHNPGGPAPCRRKGCMKAGTVRGSEQELCTANASACCTVFAIVCWPRLTSRGTELRIFHAHRAHGPARKLHSRPAPAHLECIRPSLAPVIASAQLPSLPIPSWLAGSHLEGVRVNKTARLHRWQPPPVVHACRRGSL